MSEESSKKNAQEEEKKSGSFKKIMIIFVGLIVLSAGGYFGFNYFLKSEGNNEEKEVVQAKQIPNETINIPLDPFIVNLADEEKTGKRYLKITMVLEMIKVENTDELIQKNMPKIKDSILLLLTTLEYNDINTLEGKLFLKKEIIKRINRILNGDFVKNIYFVDFVVQ